MLQKLSEISSGNSPKGAAVTKKSDRLLESIRPLNSMSLRSRCRSARGSARSWAERLREPRLGERDWGKFSTEKSLSGGCTSASGDQAHHDLRQAHKGTGSAASGDAGGREELIKLYQDMAAMEHGASLDIFPRTTSCLRVFGNRSP